MWLDIGCRCVKLQLLDEDDNVETNASGFILQGSAGFDLYTCWHVVTGIDPRTLLFRSPPTRRKVRILSTSIRREANGMSFGGIHEKTVALYSADGTPRWAQEKRERPQADLNSIGLRVPLVYDAVRLPIGSLSALQQTYVAIPQSMIWRSDPKQVQQLRDHARSVGEDPSSIDPAKMLLTPGVADRMFVVGFPYGYSARPGFIDPMFLTRFVAHIGLGPNHGLVFLDNAAAPGMSGGPVWVPHSRTEASLAGLYVGSIFPDYQARETESAHTTSSRRENDRHAAIGVYVSLSFLTYGFDHQMGETGGPAP
jgi:hypothetical protein